MIIYLLLLGFVSILSFLINLIPSFSTPAWFTTQLPDVLMRIASFNYYLPVFETVGVVIFLITFTLSWKMIKVVLNIAHIDLNQ